MRLTQAFISHSFIQILDLQPKGNNSAANYSACQLTWTSVRLHRKFSNIPEMEVMRLNQSFVSLYLILLIEIQFKGKNSSEAVGMLKTVSRKFPDMPEMKLITLNQFL